MVSQEGSSRACWELVGAVLLALAADASRSVVLVLAGSALASVTAGMVVSGPEDWARLGDPAAWRGSKR